MTPETKLKIKSLLINDMNSLKFDEDISYFIDYFTRHMNFFDDLKESAKVVLLYMCFRVGCNNLFLFTNFILALESKDYLRAAKELAQGECARQLGEQAETLAKIMRE